RPRGQRNPRRRGGRHGRHRTALLCRARPRPPHPRRRPRSPPVPELEPLRPRPDAGDEGRLLQPRGPQAVAAWRIAAARPFRVETAAAAVGASTTDTYGLATLIVADGGSDSRREGRVCPSPEVGEAVI